jgi:hypothetical protein
MVSEVSPESSMQSYGTGVFPRTVAPLSGLPVGSPSVMGEPPRVAVIDQTSVMLDRSRSVAQPGQHSVYQPGQ